jgi:hypothetical protein
MAMKMSGSALSVNTFACYYETHMHKKIVKGKQTKTEMVAHYGSYNFVPKKTRGTVSIVPAYHNKWPRWTEYWFYHRVCSDEDVAEAMANDLPKAHILVSEMTPMDGYRLANLHVDSLDDVAVADALAMTSRFQISRDLVEEWVACDSPPLSGKTHFFGFERKDGYVCLDLGIDRPDAYSTDFSFVNLVEHKAEQIVGFYGKKEHKGKCQYLAGKR